MRALRTALTNTGRLALVSVAIYSVLPSSVSELLVENNVSVEITKSRSSTGFVIAGRGWTDFVIPPEQSMLKVVSNANVPEASYSIQDLQCEYTLRIEVIDGSEHALKAQDVVLRSGPLIYRDEVTGAALPAQTYLTVPLLPLSSRTTVVNIENFESNARRVRVSLVQTDPRIKDVSVRVYANQKPAEYKLRYMWQRMPLEKRERLARAGVHGLDFLTDKEKEYLLENRWVAVAPVGIDGREFFERKLYTLRERYDSVLSGSILPFGLFVGPGTLGTIPIPESGGCIRLDLQRVPGTPPSPVVRLAWRGRAGLESLEMDLAVSDGLLSQNLDLAGGILELESSDAIIVRAYLEGETGVTEITPEAKCAQGYRVRREAPVEFSIVSGGDGLGAFRLDVRRVPMAGASDESRQILLTYDLLDEGRRVIRSGEIVHAEGDSWYDRVTGTSQAVPVSDPSRHYFSISAKCATFRVSSRVDSACVTAYTRPNELVRKLRIPEDYLLFERMQEDSRTWFPLRPQRFAECVANECEVFVKTQPRLPGPSAELEAAGSHTETCVPEGDVNALKVLTPVDPASLKSWEASPAYFAKLGPERTRNLYLGDESGAPRVRPRIIALKHDDSLSQLSLSVDGELHFQAFQASRSNEESVLPIAEGWHDLRVDALPGTDVYVNSLLVEAEDLFLERTVHGIEKEGLKYRVFKQTPQKETLALRTYLPSDLRAEMVMSVSIRGVTKTEGVPSDTWTYPETVYQVRCPEEGQIPVVGTNEGPLSGGELFLAYLGADLSPGWYDVVVRREAGPPSFLSLLHTIPGTKEERRVSSESSITDGDFEP